MSNKIMKTLTINGVTYQVQDPRVTDLTDAFNDAANNLNDRAMKLEDTLQGVDSYYSTMFDVSDLNRWIYFENNNHSMFDYDVIKDTHFIMIPKIIINKEDIQNSFSIILHKYSHSFEGSENASVFKFIGTSGKYKLTLTVKNGVKDLKTNELGNYYRYDLEEISTEENGGNIDLTNYYKVENIEIASESWSVLNDSAPYTYSATVTLTNLTSDSTSIELINNNPVLFAAHGFAIASVSGSTVTIYSIDQPSTDVTLTFEIVNPVSEGE